MGSSPVATSDTDKTQLRPADNVLHYTTRRGPHCEVRGLMLSNSYRSIDPTSSCHRIFCLDVREFCFFKSSQDRAFITIGDLGVHIDDFVALVARTVVVPDPSAPGPINDKKDNVIAACYTAAEAVLRLIQPKVKNNRVSEYITKVADEFRCQPLQGVLSHELRQFVIDANNTIIGKIDPDQGLKVDEFEFETNQVFGIDIVMSTGDGKGRELNEQTTVFKREVDVNYNLKMQASRRFLAEVNRRFPTYPFTLRSIEDKSARLGLTECLKHDLLQPYPVLFEKEGEFVAQLKFTVLLMPSGIMKITGLDGVDLSQIQSEYSVQDEDLKALLAQPIKSKKRRRKKNKKKKNTANEGGEAAMDVE
eukprot:809397_1